MVGGESVKKTDEERGRREESGGGVTNKVKTEKKKRRRRVGHTDVAGDGQGRSVGGGVGDRQC